MTDGKEVHTRARWGKKSAPLGEEDGLQKSIPEIGNAGSPKRTCNNPGNADR